MIATHPPLDRIDETFYASEQFVVKLGFRIERCERMDATLPARVNHGRWIVDCPDCHGAEMPFADGYFICASCIAEDGRFKQWRVEFPKERAAIEAALEPRPKRNQNWEPSEPVANLIAENEAQKV